MAAYWFRILLALLSADMIRRSMLHGAARNIIQHMKNSPPRTSIHAHSIEIHSPALLVHAHPATPAFAFVRYTFNIILQSLAATKLNGEKPSFFNTNLINGY